MPETQSIKSIRKILGEVLRIHGGEWLIVGLLQLQIFLTITVLLMAKPAATGVFLANYSAAQLPWMYLLTAAVAGVVSYLYSLAMGRYSFLKVNLWTLTICLFSLLFFAILEPLSTAGQLLAIGLYTWVGVFGVLAASQFWMMANLVFDVRQAKRLFGLRYPASDIIPIYRALNDKEGRHRASALELLDNLLNLPIRKRVIPVLDPHYKETIKRSEPSTDTLDRPQFHAAQVENFGRLLAGDDARLKLAVIYLIGRLGETGYVPMLTARLKDADERVAEQARIALVPLV